MDSRGFDLHRDNIANSEGVEELLTHLAPTAEEEQYTARWNQKLEQVFHSIDLQFPAPADPSDRIKVWRGVDGMPLTEAEYRREQQELKNGSKSLKRTRDEVEPEAEDTVTPVNKTVRKDAVDTPIIAAEASLQQANSSSITKLQLTTSHAHTSPLDKLPMNSTPHGDMTSKQQSTSGQAATTAESYEDVFATQLKMANCAFQDDVFYHQEPLQPMDHLSQAEIDSFFEDDDTFIKDNVAVEELDRVAADMSPSPPPASPREQWNAMSPVASLRLFEAVSPADAKVDMSKCPGILQLPQEILAQVFDHLGWETAAQLALMHPIFREAAFDSAAFKFERSHEDSPVPPPVSPLPEKEVVEIEDDVDALEEEGEEVVPTVEMPPTEPLPSAATAPVSDLIAMPAEVPAVQPAAAPIQQPSEQQMQTYSKPTITPGEYLTNPFQGNVESHQHVVPPRPVQSTPALIQQPTPVRVPHPSMPAVPMAGYPNALVQQSAARSRHGVPNGMSTIQQQQSTGRPMPPAQQMMMPSAQQHTGTVNQYPLNMQIMQQFFVPGMSASHGGMSQEPLMPAAFTQAMPRAPSAASSSHPVSPAIAGRKRKHMETSPSKVQPDMMNVMGTPYPPFFPSPATSTPATPTKRQRVQGPQPGQVNTPTGMNGMPGPGNMYTPGRRPVVQPGAYGGMPAGYHNLMQTPQMMQAQMHAQQGRPNLQVQTQMHPQVRAGPPAGQPPRPVYTPQPGRMMQTGMQQVRGPTPQAMGQRPPMSREQMLAQQTAMREEYARRQAAATAMLQKNAVGRQTPQAGMGYGGRTPAQMQQLAQMQAQQRPQIPVGVQRQMNGMGGMPQMMQQRPGTQPGMVPSHPAHLMRDNRPPQGLGIMMPNVPTLQGTGTTPVLATTNNQQFSGTGLTPVSAVQNQHQLLHQGAGSTPTSASIPNHRQTLQATDQSADMPADYLQDLEDLMEANRNGQNGMGGSWLPW